MKNYFLSTVERGEKVLKQENGKWVFKAIWISYIQYQNKNNLDV